MKVGDQPHQLGSGAWQWPCEAHGALVTATLKPGGWTKPHHGCTCGMEVLQPTLDAIKVSLQPTFAVAEAPRGNGHVNGNGHPLRVPQIDQWRAKVFSVLQRVLNDPSSEYQKRAVPAAAMLDFLVDDAKRSLFILKTPPPAEFSQTEIDEECERLARIALEEWAGGIDLDRALPALQNGNGAVTTPGVSKYAIGVGAPALSALRVYTADEFFAATDYLDRIEWSWDEIFPSTGLVGVFGDPEAGKSTFCRTFALAASREEPCLGRNTRQSKVLYLDLADEQLSHRRAFKNLGWTGNDMALVSQDSLIGNPNALDLVETAIKLLKANIVVVDMMADLLTFRDLNDYANAKEALRGLRMLCRETSALFIVLHHTPKALGPDADVLKAGLGSQAIVGAFDLRIAIRRRAKDLSTIVMSNGKVGGRPLTTEHSLIRNPETEWLTLGQPWESARKDYYAEKIHEYFKLQGVGEKMTALQIAETLDLNPGFIRASLRTLTRDRRLEREGEGKPHKPFYYRLPDWVPPEKDSRYKDD